VPVVVGRAGAAAGVRVMRAAFMARWASTLLTHRG
jgi:hypothetical protein